MRSSAARFVAVVLLCLPLAACSSLIQSARGLTVGDVVRGGQPKRLFAVATRGDSLRPATLRVPGDSAIAADSTRRR
ncbi:MAG TPA: hypothetical protein VFH97_10375 [Gemmatimonadales bacterium]|nr:hypothetical protein [Gemmatimonadales bacterium]